MEQTEETEKKEETAGSLKEMRLQVYLAKCGIASRRAAEKLIESGRVTVNGKTVTELGTKFSGT